MLRKQLEIWIPAVLKLQPSICPRVLNMTITLLPTKLNIISKITNAWKTFNDFILKVNISGLFLQTPEIGNMPKNWLIIRIQDIDSWKHPESCKSIFYLLENLVIWKKKSRFFCLKNKKTVIFKLKKT